MKNLLTCFVAVLSTMAAFAQNLVPNPNFSLHDTCPDNHSQLTKCKYWYNPTLGSPDYLNACHDTLATGTGTVGVPDNTAGSQPAIDSAYIGVYVLIDASADYREYVRADIPALFPGSVYRVLMKVSLADNSYYATHAPGVFFYKSMNFDMAAIYNIPRTPQIDFSAAGHITDKTNWVTVIDTFTADSSYTHLIVGNFNDDISTAKTMLSSPISTHYGYYYIDSISVELVVITPSALFTNTDAGARVALYPNPFTDRAVLNIENITGSNNTLTIMNVQGAVVKKMDNIGSGQTTISRDGLDAGFYYYRLHTQDGAVLNGKMIIR